jgi:hypothetical protein
VIDLQERLLTAPWRAVLVTGRICEFVIPRAAARSQHRLELGNGCIKSVSEIGDVCAKQLVKAPSANAALLFN